MCGICSDLFKGSKATAVKHKAADKPDVVKLTGLDLFKTCVCVCVNVVIFIIVELMFGLKSDELGKRALFPAVRLYPPTPRPPVIV